MAETYHRITKILKTHFRPDNLLNVMTSSDDINLTFHSMLGGFTVWEISKGFMKKKSVFLKLFTRLSLKLKLIVEKEKLINKKIPQHTEKINCKTI